MGRNIVKVLEKKFADMKAGDRMYISSPEEIKSFIINIPRGTYTRRSTTISDRSSKINTIRGVREFIINYLEFYLY